MAVEVEQEGPTAEDRKPSDVIIRGPPDWCDHPSDVITDWCDHPSDVITWPMDPTHTMRLLEKMCGTTHATTTHATHVDDYSYCLSM